MLTRHTRSGVHVRPRRGDLTGYAAPSQTTPRAASGCQGPVASLRDGQTSRRRVVY